MPTPLPAEAFPAKEWLRIFAILLVLLALLALCTIGPVLIAGLLDPAIGCIASLAACFVWVYLGPRPMPGLLSGIFALSGLLAIIAVGFGILASLIGQLAR